MNIYKTVGELLEEVRQKNNISCQVLCDGICDVSTYSRYENDINVPDFFVLTYLMERLGLNPMRITSLIPTNEIEIIKKHQSIQRAIIMGNNNDAKNLLLELNNNRMVKKNIILQQYILYYEGELLSNEGYCIEAKKKYAQAIELTYRNPGSVMYSVLEYNLKIKLLLLDTNAIEKLFNEEHFLREKNDSHILKIQFYDMVVVNLCRLAFGKWSNDYLLDIINNALTYKYRICQSKNIYDLLSLKKKLGNDLTTEENALLLIRNIDFLNN